MEWREMAFRHCAWAVILLAAVASAAQPEPMPNVSAGVTAALAKQATVDVMIRLDVDPQASTAAIAAAQTRLASTMSAVSGWKLRRRLESIPYVVGQIDSAGIGALAGSPYVAGVMEDLPLHGSLAQSVPLIGGDRAASTYSITGSGIVVGFIDTGIDTTHADLTGAVQASRRIIKGDSNTTDITDDNGHGTHLAGILTGNGVVAPHAGVAPACKLVVIKALDKNNSGYMSDFISGIDWIITNHASFPTLKFILLSANFSASASTLCPCDSLVQTVSSYQAFLDVIARAKAAGILIIVPTGNDGSAGLVPPACFNGIVAVAASFDTSFSRAPTSGTYYNYSSAFPDIYDTNATTNMLAGFSNHGACTALVAPGYNITSDRVGGGTLSSFGTSMAAAHVAGALALLQQRAPAATAEELVAVLRATGKAIPDPSNATVTYPLIDVYAAAAKFGSNKATNWTVYR